MICNENTIKLIEAIGLEAGLRFTALRVYTNVMAECFPYTTESYWREWAWRFVEGTAWSYADNGTRSVIKREVNNLVPNVEDRNVWLRMQGFEGTLTGE